MTSTLTPWSYPSSYIGKSHDGWMVFLSQNRDSGLLDRSNFICGLDEVRRASMLLHTDFAPHIVSDNHWACGWVEWIAIHESDESAIKAADLINHRLDQYPIVDEQHYSEMESSASQNYWKSAGLKGRIDILKSSRAQCSALVARHEFLPDDDSVRDYVRDCCN